MQSPSKHNQELFSRDKNQIEKTLPFFRRTPLIGYKQDENASQVVRSTSMCSARAALQDALSEQIMIQKRVSFLLRDFFGHFTGKDLEQMTDMAKYKESILFANKCLLEAGEPRTRVVVTLIKFLTVSFATELKRGMLEKQIQQKPNEVLESHIGRGCLELHQISIPLRFRCKFLVSPIVHF